MQRGVGALLDTRIDQLEQSLKSSDQELKNSSPVIDGHVDLPIMVREAYGNDVTKLDLSSETVRPAHPCPCIFAL